MSDLKTQPTEQSVDEFLDGVEHPTRREDGRKLMEMMREVTGEEPELWGPSIVGFGRYHYVYDSGREGDWFLTGFSPRKSSLSLYVMSGATRHDELLAKLGKHKTGKACLYVNKLDDVDLVVLRELIDESVRHMRARYPDASRGDA